MTDTYDAFKDLLSIMDEEDLIRWKRRAKINNRSDLVELFTEEIINRGIASINKDD
jgi:hypothetical protein